MLLATSGQRVLSVDDDTVCTPSTVGRPSGLGCSFDSRSDPRVHRFFLDRAQAFGAAAPIQVDICRAHETLLGRDLPSIVAAEEPNYLAFADADSDLIDDLGSARGRVILTTMGVVGQSGVTWPQRLLQMEPSWAAQLLESEPLYSAAVRSHEVAATVCSPTLSNRSFFSTMFFALDDTASVPPFFPILRSQDFLFWRALRYCVDDGYVGHLPLLLAHDPARDRSRTPDIVWRHTGVEFAYLLSDVLQKIPAASCALPSHRTSELGYHFRDLASAPLFDLEEMLGGMVRRRWEHRLRFLDARRRALPGGGPWHRDVERHLIELERRIAATAVPPPFDLGIAGREGWRVARELLGQFATVLISWPDLVQGAQRLVARDEGWRTQNAQRVEA
jgi:hypothetical protein